MPQMNSSVQIHPDTAFEMTGRLKGKSNAPVRQSLFTPQSFSAYMLEIFYLAFTDVSCGRYVAEQLAGWKPGDETKGAAVSVLQSYLKCIESEFFV
jgi:hypothetical protein